MLRWRWYPWLSTSPSADQSRRGSRQAYSPLLRLDSWHQHWRDPGTGSSEWQVSEGVPETVLQNERVCVCWYAAVSIRSPGNYSKGMFG